MPLPTRRVVVWARDWPITAAGIDPATPAVVLAANRVITCSAAARKGGITVGMPRRRAQRQHPGVVIVDADPDRDGRMFEPVARAIGELTPRIEVIEPGWVCFDARGPSRFYGGDAAFAVHLAHEVASRSGVTVQVGVADGRFAASIAARRAFAEPLVVAPGSSPSFLAPLHAGWLSRLGEIDAGTVDLFVRLGLRRLGDVAALAPADLHGRFGPVGAHAHRLAAGLDERPMNAIEPPADWQVGHAFDQPVTTVDPLVFTGKRLADTLTATLAANGSVCTRLVVTAETDHGEHEERAWYRATGLSSAAMTERVRWQLTAWSASNHLTAGVVLLRLHPAEVRRNDGEQPGLWGGHSDTDARAHRTIARLTGLLGDEAVFVAAWSGGRLPGDRYQWVPAATVDLAESTRRLRPDRGHGPWPGALPTPAPAVVYPEPIPATLTDPEGHPIEVTGRGELTGTPASLTAGRHAAGPIEAWAGPWPVDDYWWDTTRRRRAARLQLLTAAGEAHLALAERRRWWIIATYA